MKKIILSISIVIFSMQILGQAVSISGKILDQNTSEPLVGAVVKHISSGNEVSTDFDGNFKINGVEEGVNKLSISYISYQETKLNHVVVKSGEETHLKIKLKRINKTTSPQNFLAKESQQKIGT